MSQPHDLKIKAIIWDIDGTLLDSNDAHAESYRIAFERNGFLVPLDLIRKKIGMGSDKLMPSLIGKEHDSSIGKKIGETKDHLYTHEFFPKLAAFPDARELVQEIHRLGIRSAVATSAPKKQCDAALKRIGIGEIIDTLITADDVESSKPDASPIHEALKGLKLAPDEVLMIGDTPYDIEAARKAGVNTIAFRSGGWNDVDLKAGLEIYDGASELFEKIKSSAIFKK